LYYNLVDMHNLTPNIQEVMTFPNWLSVKQKYVETAVRKLCCIALFGPSKQILP
jgi:hypothetical protein